MALFLFLLLTVAAGAIIFYTTRTRLTNAKIIRRLDWIRDADQLSATATAEAEEEEDEGVFVEQKETLFSRFLDQSFYLLRHEEQLQSKLVLVGLGAGLVASGGWVVTGGSLWVVVLLFPVAGAGSAWLFLSILKSRATARFLEDLPVAVEQIAQLTRSGLLATQAMTIAGQQQREPLQSVLQDLSRRLASGLFVGEAIEQVAGRVKLAQFRMVCVVILLQREAGGSIAKPLLNIAESLRYRGKILRKVKAATGQSRLTLGIISLMPVFVLGAQTQTSPQSVEYLLYDPSGQPLLIAGVVLILAGLGVAMALTKNIE